MKKTLIGLFAFITTFVCFSLITGHDYYWKPNAPLLPLVRENEEPNKRLRFEDLEPPKKLPGVNYDQERNFFLNIRILDENKKLVVGYEIPMEIKVIIK